MDRGPAFLSGGRSLNRQMGGDLGYEYVQSLIRAIEAFTCDIEAKNPAAFQYRGANLKYAVERSLYFSHVNNERLYTVFVQWVRDELPPVIDLATVLERDLAVYLCGRDLAPTSARVRPFFQLLRSLSHLRKWTRHLALYPWMRLRTVSLARKRKAAVLIHVVHDKFVRYLRPVTDRMPVSFAYLLTANQVMKPFLKKQGLPFIECARLLKLSSGSQLEGVMARFRYLAALYDQLHSILKVLRPQCMVVVEGNAPEDEIANQVSRQLSISIVCIQQGWSPVVHNGFRNMSYTKMLVWGEGFAKLLQPYNPNQKFVAVGNHAVHSHFVESRLGGGADRKAVCFFLQAPGRLIAEASWRKFLNLVKRVASEFKEVPVLVREHPSFPLAKEPLAELLKFPNVRFVSPGDYSLTEVLSASRLTVSIYSSTILESIAAGVLPVIFNMTSLPAYFPDVHAAGAGIEVKTFEKAIEVIRRILTDEFYVRQFVPAMRQFRDKYFCQGGQEAVDRIVEEITSSG